MKFYWLLFKETFLISAFTFGGGYVIVPLMKKKFVDELGLIVEDEMLDMVALAQTAPGALAVNTAVLLGYKLKGILGALTCVISTILPPFIIITIVSHFYEAFKENIYINNALLGMRAGVAAVIIFAVINMMKPNLKSKVNISLMILSFCLIAILNISAIKVLICTFLFASIYAFFKIRKESKL